MVKKLRVLLISGSFPPIKCGVGEYSYNLVKSVAKEPSIEIGILSTSTDDKSVNAVLENISFLPNSRGWRIRDASHVIKLIVGFRPDIVHIQYPTTEYHGLLPRFLPLLLKFLGISVVQTWHEHYVQCSSIGWQNVLGCDALIYVRPDFISLLPRWVRWWLKKTPKSYIPNASTIPILDLDNAEALSIRCNLSAENPIVSFFGFANENKGIEHIFNIANPTNHHLVLVCDLNKNNPYQNKILQLSTSDAWAGNVTITGYLPEEEVSKILLVSDAIVFPFPEGTGAWNTSLKAAEPTGTFILATTKDTSLLGYQASNNIYFCACDEINSMRPILERYLGTRIKPKHQYGWKNISTQHLAIYNNIKNH